MSIDVSKTNLYEFLEVEPFTTEEEIRKSYKGLQLRFNPDAMIVYGLFERTEAKELLEDLRQVYETLLDPTKKQEYDAKHYPEGEPPRSNRNTPKNAFTSRMRPLVPPDIAEEFLQDRFLNGKALSDLRDLQHISLEEISERTKIQLYYLQAIEKEDFESLPAEVYVKGFLKQVAQVLSVPTDRLLSEYLQAYFQWKSKKQSK